MSKGKVFWKIVWEGDERGNPLPTHMQKNIYWVFTDTDPPVFVCSGPTLETAQKRALGLGYHFEDDAEPEPEPEPEKSNVPTSEPGSSASGFKTPKP